MPARSGSHTPGQRRGKRKACGGETKRRETQASTPVVGAPRARRDTGLLQMQRYDEADAECGMDVEWIWVGPRNCHGVIVPGRTGPGGGYGTSDTSICPDGGWDMVGRSAAGRGPAVLAGTCRRWATSARMCGCGTRAAMQNKTACGDRSHAADADTQTDGQGGRRVYSEPREQGFTCGDDYKEPCASGRGVSSFAFAWASWACSARRRARLEARNICVNW